jgi:hypothetical protein
MQELDAVNSGALKAMTRDRLREQGASHQSFATLQRRVRIHFNTTSETNHARLFAQDFFLNASCFCEHAARYDEPPSAGDSQTNLIQIQTINYETSNNH